MKRKIKYILAGLLGLIGLVSIGGKVVNAEEAGEDNTGETSDATTVVTREYKFDFSNYQKAASVDATDSVSAKSISINTNSNDPKNSGIRVDKTISFTTKSKFYLSLTVRSGSSYSEGKNQGLSITYDSNSDNSTFDLGSDYKKNTDKTLDSKLLNSGEYKIDKLTNSGTTVIKSLTIKVVVTQTSYTQDGSKDVDGYTTRFARFITTVNNASELNDLADAKYQVVYNNLTYNVNAYVCDALYDGENVYTTDGITFNAQDDVKYIICTIAYDYKDNGETKKYSGDLTFNIILNGVTIATKTTILA